MGEFTELAKRILEKAQYIDACNAAANTEKQSAEEIENTQSELNELVDLADAFKRKAQGPTRTFLETLYSFASTLSYRAIYQYQLPQKVPVDRSITYTELASLTSIDESLIRRFCRHAMANLIFASDGLDAVKHTELSLLLRNQGAFDVIGYALEEMASASNETLFALEKYGNSGTNTETGYNIAKKTALPMYIHLAKEHPERARRFGSAMAFFSTDHTYDLKYLVRSYPWHDIKTLVDVGGGHGTVSKRLVQDFPQMFAIIQDLPETAEAGQKTLSAELEGKVEFTAHDFFTEQSVVGADAYFLRFILHNYNDDNCVKILKNLVPAMRDGNRILVYEYLVEDGRESDNGNRIILDLDMAILSVLNGQERSMEEWRRLFERVDPGLHFKGVHRAKGSKLGLVEAVWNPEKLTPTTL